MAVASACVDDWDCSLAGECVAGTCKCESWVKGDDCGAVNFKPLANAAALKPLVQPPDNSSRWGGSVVEDGGMYHLFSAEMSDECDLSVWGFKSQVIHSTSSSPMGPFTRKGVVVGAEAHNPVLSRAVDGTWLLWTCGCPSAHPPAGCGPSTLICPGGREAAWTTTLYSSASLDGPWEPHVDLLGNVTKGREIGSQNVSPVMEKDGSVSLVFKGPDNNTEASIATAPHWKGPYTLIAVNIFAKYFAKNITVEDVYMWKSDTGVYHTLSHRMTPAERESPNCGGHAFATNFTHWGFSETPAYATEIAVADGSVVNISSRERPQVYFKPGTTTPGMLVSGVKDETGKTFTFSQELF